MAGNGRGLGWIVLSLIACDITAAEPDPATAPPSRELLLYLAQFDGASAEAIDPIELASLADGQLAGEGTASPVAAQGSGPVTAPRAEDGDDQH